ncbi:MAG: hypothetical protein V8Q95_06785 [Collinsella sp.]
MASGGGHVTAVSSYIAYARALNRLGWTPAEFVVAESFVVRLRGMLGRRPVAANGLPLVMAFPRCSSVHTCFMAYPIDIAFIDARRQYPRALRKRTSLAYVLLPRRLGRTRASFNHCFDPCSPTRAGLRIGDSGLSSYEIG